MHEPLALFFVVLLICWAISAYIFWSMGKARFWRGAVRRFEKADRVQPIPPGVIIFTGSSSINFWKTLARDMAPLSVVNRGFGGSQMAHLTYYAPRIVLPYSPSAVIVYAGENDLSWPWSKAPETITHDFQEFVDVVHAQLPATWIYFVSIKPTPLRWRQWQKQRRTNELIEDFCRTKPHVEFVDISTTMLNSSGKPRRELFWWDGLHPSAKCYVLWTSILRPILLKRFAALVFPASRVV